MPWPRRRSVLCLAFAFSFAFALACGGLSPAAASDTSFPFGSALFLDAEPLPGSKRIPMIEIEENGTVSFNLWCSTVEGAAKVTDDKITIVPTKALAAQCTPDGLSRDAGLLAALSQVTGWRRNGAQIDFLGATTLHFHLATN